MNGRRAIHLDSFAHANPVPAASRVGPLLMSGALTGKDPVTGTMPDTLEAQVANVFALVRAVMASAGGTTDDIVKLTVHLVDYRDRAALNRAWTEMFADPTTLPARQVLAASLDGGARIHVDLVAWLTPSQGDA
ncbi:RidA family protein [Microbacterium sp. NPDC058389]|uniref:RidA family protein n=1 Tax=Microbacterium sp. NPDC058389 TaxID=3346475 RepID=UPI00365DD89F